MRAEADACPCQAYGIGGGGGTDERRLERRDKKKKTWRTHEKDVTRKCVIVEVYFANIIIINISLIILWD